MSLDRVGMAGMPYPPTYCHNLFLYHSIFRMNFLFYIWDVCAPLPVITRVH